MFFVQNFGAKAEMYLEKAATKGICTKKRAKNVDEIDTLRVFFIDTATFRVVEGSNHVGNLSVNLKNKRL